MSAGDAIQIPSQRLDGQAGSLRAKWLLVDNALIVFGAFVLTPEGATVNSNRWAMTNGSAEKLLKPVWALTAEGEPLVRTPQSVRRKFNEAATVGLTFGPGRQWGGSFGTGQHVTVNTDDAVMMEAYKKLRECAALLHQVARQRPQWVKTLVAEWPDSATGHGLLAARAYPLWICLYAAGEVGTLSAVAFRLRDILRQPTDPTGTHIVDSAAEALPLPGSAQRPADLDDIRIGGNLEWAKSWIDAGRLPVTPSVSPQPPDDDFPGGAAEAARMMAGVVPADALPVPEMPDLFEGAPLPWELLRAFADSHVYNLHATTLPSLPLQAVLALRWPLQRIFNALPSMEAGTGFTADDVLARLSHLPQLSAPDSTGWRLDHWKALCGSATAAAGDAEPFREAFAGFVVWMSHSTAEVEDALGPGHRTRTALVFRLLQVLPRWLLTRLPAEADKATAAVKRRCELLTSGEWATLNESAAAAEAMARARPPAIDDPVGRAVAAMRTGRASRAASALREEGAILPTAGSPFADTVLRKLAEKHPSHPVTVAAFLPGDGLPLGTASLLAGGRISALSKDPTAITPAHTEAATAAEVPDDFKVRPIVTHSVWRRLSALLQANGTEVGRRLREVGQYAVATPGGLDVLVHAIRLGVRTGGARVAVAQVDAVNAFNQVLRDRVLAGIRKYMPGAEAAFLRWYGCVGLLTTRSLAAFLSTVGVQQGDVDGTLFYCLATADLLEEAAGRYAVSLGAWSDNVFFWGEQVSRPCSQGRRQKPAPRSHGSPACPRSHRPFQATVSFDPITHPCSWLPGMA
jgi:hypothetical protein